MNIRERFKRYAAEFLKFDRIAVKRSGRPDLHAFLLLDELVPGDEDVVCYAEHGEIFLQPGLEDVAAKITDEQVLELVRCGVRCDGEGLRMFV